MVMKNGKAGMFGPKDHMILRDLFLCRYLTAAQIAILHYNSVERARTRLSQLRKKGLVENRVIYTMAPTGKPGTRDYHPGKWEGVWYLTKDADGMMSASVDFEDGGGERTTWAPRQLQPPKMRHHVRINELYLAIKSDLDHELGEFPHWVWEHEKWATDSYTFHGPRKHKPDAHVLMGGETFVIERQTRESHVTLGEIRNKVADRATWARVWRQDLKNTQVVFACEEERVAEVARRAGKDHNIYTFAGTVEEAAYHLYQSALRIRATRRPGGEPAA